MKARTTVPFYVTIDPREPEETAWTFSPGVVVTRKTMKTADYAPTGFEDGVFGIERKTLADLIACCTYERPRFIAEMERFASFEFKCIVVEAALDDVAKRNYRSRVHPSAVVGSVVAFHVDYAVPTIWAGSPAAAARIAERLMRRFVEKRAAKTEAA